MTWQFFFFQAEDGIRVVAVTGVQTCALPIYARLDDGSRVNVVIPPLAIDGPIMSIRRFGRTPIGVDQLLAKHTLTSPLLELLKSAVKARLNIIVSGGTGAGKTTLM